MKLSTCCTPTRDLPEAKGNISAPILHSRGEKKSWKPKNDHNTGGKKIIGLPWN